MCTVVGDLTRSSSGCGRCFSPNIDQGAFSTENGVVIWNGDASAVLCFFSRFHCVGFAKVVVPFWTSLHAMKFSTTPEPAGAINLGNAADLGVKSDIFIVFI